MHPAGPSGHISKMCRNPKSGENHKKTSMFWIIYDSSVAALCFKTMYTAEQHTFRGTTTTCMLVTALDTRRDASKMQTIVVQLTLTCKDFQLEDVCRLCLFTSLVWIWFSSVQCSSFIYLQNCFSCQSLISMFLANQLFLLTLFSFLSYSELWNSQFPNEPLVVASWVFLHYRTKISRTYSGIKFCVNKVS